MQRQMSIEQIYNIRNNIQSFGLDSYEVPREYLDPSAIISNRELLEQIKKGIINLSMEGQVKAKEKNRVHKSVFDVIMSQANRTPAPNAYQKNLTFGVPKPEGVKPIIFKDNKNLPQRKTFLDYAQKNIVPGPGNYPPKKSDFIDPPTKEQVKAQKNRRYAQRSSIFGDNEYLGWNLPPPDRYMIKSSIITNDRQASKQLDKKYYLEIEQKHADFEKNRLKMPSPSHYHPIPLSGSFEKSLQNLNIKGDLKDKSLKPHSDFSKNERFKYYDKKKDQRTKITPGPGSYNLLFEWEGKKDPKKQQDTRIRSYDKAISKGISQSIYY